MGTKSKRRYSQQAQELVRFKVADYLGKKLGTQKQCAEVFGLSEMAVNRIWAKYKKGGKRALRSKKRGVQGGNKLKKDQAYQIRQLIKDKLPDQLKLPFGLWTREAVQQLIAIKYGVELSRWQVGRYLKKWGYTPQKPIKKAFEQKPEKVQKWLREEYPAIKERAKKEKAIIYFGDETGCRSNHQAGRSYAPKGKTPIIMATGKRFTVNMISAISNRGHLQFMLMEAGFNSEVFQKFLQQMIKHSRKKIFFITDNHPAHKTKKRLQWLEEKINELDEVIVKGDFKFKEFNVEEFNLELKNQIKEDIDNNPYIYEPPSNGNFDFIKVTAFIIRQFKKGEKIEKNKVTINKFISRVDLEEIFSDSNDNLFNVNFLNNELSIPKKYIGLFFDYFESLKIENSYLNSGNNFLLLDSLIVASSDFLKLIENDKVKSKSVIND